MESRDFLGYLLVPRLMVKINLKLEQLKLGMVAYAYNPSYSGGCGRSLAGSGPGKQLSETNKHNNQKRQDN